MAIITKYFSRNVSLYVSQPYAETYNENVAALETFGRKPNGILTADGSICQIEPTLDYLNTKYSDRPGVILRHIAEPNMLSNILIATLGNLLLVDLARYNDAVESITVDHFVIEDDNVSIIFKMMIDDSEDIDLAIDFLNQQIVDGWGEDPSDEVVFNGFMFKDPSFFELDSTTPKQALFDIERYQELPPDIQEAMYTPEFVEHLLRAITYNQAKVSLRLAFGYENLRAFED